MSDAELLELYAQYVEAFSANLTIAITLVFAYLVAAFLSAKKLSGIQFYSTTGLFAVFTMSVAMGAYEVGLRTASIQSEILRRVSAQDSQISFIAAEGMPTFIPPYVLGIIAIAVILSIAFAISIRRGDT